MPKARVIFQDLLKTDLSKAVSEIFKSFGGGRSLLKSSGDVYIKVNGVDSKPHVYTSPEITGAVVRYFKKQGARKIYVIENCTQGSFTRLVFEITGMRKMCADTGAIPVYLDETREMPFFLQGLNRYVRIPDFVQENLIEGKDENLYISMPKLKTHSMSTVTLGIKNQLGLVHQMSRIPDHNHRLHQKLADIYAGIQPDFTLVDGTEATNFGHYPSQAHQDKCVVPMNLLFGGDDPMAVDVVGAELLGFDLGSVEHLKLAAEYNIGISDFQNIEIVNQDLFDQRKKKFTWDLLEMFPDDVDIIRGEIMCCTEGCRRNTEACLEVFAQDFGGKGGFSIVMGKGADPQKIDQIKGSVHLAGDCAISEWYPMLKKCLGKRKITCSPGCNNLAATVDGLTKWMKITPLQLVPINPLKSLWLLTLAKLNGSRANITPILKI